MTPILPALPLLFANFVAHALPPNAPLAHAAAPVAQDVEFEKRRTEAGDDVTRLWKLYEWCRETKREKEGKTVLRRIVKLDPTHKDANVALGNIFHDGKWFPSQQKVDEYKKAQEVAEKTAQGLVQWKGDWVPADDLPFLERGLARDPSGNWVDPESAKKLAEGWALQDLEWIPPAEKENVDKGLWKCGDEWLSIADADTYHSELTQWWRIPFPRFHLYTTCDRDTVNQRIRAQLENAYDELVRAYGAALPNPPVVIVLRDKDQYQSFAAGDDGEARWTTDVRGFSSIHHAYFADQSYEPKDDAPVLGAGVGYWDTSSEDGNKWGVHSVRHALGLSFGEAFDPSPKTLEKNLKSPMKFSSFWESFYSEKRVPEWFRYGAAAYAERYFRDNTVGVGGDPLWTRKWSISNIQARGGLRQLKQILDFNLSAEDGADSEKLINESGLVMAYLLDGGNAALTEKFKKLQAAMTSGKDKKAVAEAAKALDAEILKNDADLKKFAGL